MPPDSRRRGGSCAARDSAGRCEWQTINPRRHYGKRHSGARADAAAVGGSGSAGRGAGRFPAGARHGYPDGRTGPQIPHAARRGRHVVLLVVAERPHDRRGHHARSGGDEGQGVRFGVADRRRRIQPRHRQTGSRGGIPVGRVEETVPPCRPRGRPAGHHAERQCHERMESRRSIRHARARPEAADLLRDGRPGAAGGSRSNCRSLPRGTSAGTSAYRPCGKRRREPR